MEAAVLHTTSEKKNKEALVWVVAAHVTQC